MQWIIAVIYLIIGDVVGRCYTRKMKNKYLIGKCISKKEDDIAMQELFLFFLWLPFLFLLAGIALFEKTKTIKKNYEVQQRLKSASLRDICKGPMSLCDSANYNCSECQSVNQQHALEKIYGEKVNN